MKDIEKGQNLEITVNELIEEYSWLIAESSVQSIKKHGKMQTKTKISVKAQLKEKFDSVEYVAGAGRRKAKFTLNNYNGNKEVYERENKGGRPSLDWTNELLVIRELINQEVACNGEQFYKGFTVSQLLNEMLGFDKYTIEAITELEVQIHRIFTSSGNKEDDYYGLKETVNNIVGNHRHIYVAMIEEELSKTNHRISYLDSKRNKIDAEKYEEYLIFKKGVETKIKAENEKIRDKRSKAYKEGLNIKDLPKAKNEHKEIENAVQEKFDFKYAYRLFTVLDEIQVDGEGDIEKARGNFYNRIMKNASHSQSKHEKTEKINYSETVFFRLVHAGQYVEVMESFFTKLIDIESKMGVEVEEDSEELQRHLDGLELYMAEQRLEPHDFYDQYIYIDVERILYEMENPLTDEECEERYFELIEY